MSLRLPESLHEKAREMAEREGISINQLVATALAEKLAALMTVDCLQERASRGDRKAFEAVLKKVKDRPPVPGDELQAGGMRPRRRRPHYDVAPDRRFLAIRQRDATVDGVRDRIIVVQNWFDELKPGPALSVLPIRSR
jgi:hypothetical protein